MELKDQIDELIDASIEDTILTRGEKKKIKEKLRLLNPDKSVSDLMRSEIFDLAYSKINAENYNEILSWLEAMNKVLLSTHKIEVQQEKVLFSPGEECLDAITKYILEAKQIIRICLFTISDNRISDALIEKHKAGLDIRIISDNDKVFDKGSDIDHLIASGVKIVLDKTSNHMHHKFALFDNEITLTGSYNWTRSAEKYNHENILITDSKRVMHEYTKQFNYLWSQFDS
ncbi:phospholipase D-like domain-containing protein [Crocinitomix catalasitica]|uniref:phospholipase D-like domain-containing protein n=1 Tax=Crocinitomix catalasitica TaxID=184607 RepID=UPI00047F60D3|nr:phospholipase D-like domain-containing protein [Crocinitomix catalasitica]